MRSNIKRKLAKSYSLRFISWLAFFNFVDLLAMLLPVRPLAKRRKRVVFVKLDGMGDFVIWTASFDAIERTYPSSDYERIVVGSSKWKALAEDATTFDQKIFVDTDRFVSTFRYRLDVLRQVRGLRADIVVNPRLTREFLWSDSVVRCSGAPIKIGSRGLDNLMTKMQERISERWYTKLVVRPDREEHELISNMEFMRALDPAIDDELKIPVIAGGAPHGNFGLTGDYAILFVGSFNADRRWPIVNFAETARFVSSKYGLGIVLCGGPEDVDLARRFDNAYSEAFVNLIGKTTLQDLGCLVSSASLVVTNDTGAGHIAAASKCPTVVITPGNQVGRYFPYPSQMKGAGVKQLSVFHQMPCFGCGWYCIYKDTGPDRPKPCIGNISTEDVIGAISTLMDGEPDRSS